MHNIKGPLALISLVVIAASLAVAQQDTGDRQNSLDELFQQRDGILENLVQIERVKYEQGVGSLRSLNAAEKQLLEAKLESASAPQERIDILLSLLRLTRKREELIAGNVKNADADPTELMEAKVQRLNVQIALQREQQK